MKVSRHLDREDLFVFLEKSEALFGSILFMTWAMFANNSITWFVIVCLSTAGFCKANREIKSKYYPNYVSIFCSKFFKAFYKFEPKKHDGDFLA